jgi:hypothetical protein
MASSRKSGTNVPKLGLDRSSAHAWPVRLGSASAGSSSSSRSTTLCCAANHRPTVVDGADCGIECGSICGRASCNPGHFQRKPALCAFGPQPDLGNVGQVLGSEADLWVGRVAALVCLQCYKCGDISVVEDEFMVSVAGCSTSVPLMLRQHLQVHPSKKVDSREACYWSQARQRFRRSKGGESHQHSSSAHATCSRLSFMLCR